MRHLLLKILPKNLVSKLAGKLADQELPAPVLQKVIEVYSNIYKIDTADMETPVSSMKTFNEFFTRKLKPGLRPIDQDPGSVVSPVDGTVSEFGKIDCGLLIQTKGVYYSLEDLAGEKTAREFEDGYFVTIYLSPADYHRIHSPVDASINEFSYFSGNLWPVNDFAVKNIGSLFCLNERILTMLDCKENSRVAMVKVGATVVGKIKVNYHSTESNKAHKDYINIPLTEPKTIQKGEELGLFQLGSTVVLLFQKDQFNPDLLEKDRKVKMGEKIGSLL